MLNRLRASLHRRRTAARADRLNSALDRRAGQLLADLDGAADHDTRHRLIAKLAAAEQARAHLHRTEFGDDPEKFLSLAHAALLLRLVADTEKAIACPGHGRRYTDSPLERHAGLVLDRAVAAGRIGRAVLGELSDAVLPVVGGQAAKVLAVLPTVEHRSEVELAG
jgi:hypothetical protein